jgi:hypothetical protein
MTQEFLVQRGSLRPGQPASAALLHRTLRAVNLRTHAHTVSAHTAAAAAAAAAANSPADSSIAAKKEADHRPGKHGSLVLPTTGVTLGATYASNFTQVCLCSTMKPLHPKPQHPKTPKPQHPKTQKIKNPKTQKPKNSKTQKP